MSAAGAIDALVGLCIGLSAAFVLRRQRRDGVGLLLAVACLGWFVGSFASADEGPLQAVGSATQFIHRGLLLSAVLVAAIAAPSAPLHPRQRWTLRAAAGLAAVGCLTSAIRPLALSLTPTMVVGAIVVMIVLLALRSERDRRRRIGWSWLAVGMILWVSAATVLRWLPEPERHGRLYVYDLGIVFTSVATSRLRLVRTAVADRAIRIADSEATSPEQSLATVLGDPDLRLGFSVGEGYLAANGSRAQVATGQSATIVDVGEAGRVLIAHRPGLLDDKRLQTEVVGVVRLIAEQHRLSQQIERRTADVRASRDRLSVTEERAARQMAVEIDQRVASLVQDIREKIGQLEAPIPGASQLADDVLTELAAISRQPSVPVPPDTGLAAGLRVLSTLSPIPVDLVVADVDVDEAVERALLFVASESITNAAKHSGSDRLTIELRPEGDAVALTIADAGLGGADPRPGGGLEGLAERMAAVGGGLRVRSEAGKGTVVTAIRPARQRA